MILNEVRGFSLSYRLKERAMYSLNGKELGLNREGGEKYQVRSMC